MTIRTKAVLGILGVFVLGGVCGALVLGIVVRDRVRETRNLREREGFARFFFDKLQLSDAQNDSLRGVLDTTYRELEQLRMESSQRYAEVIDQMRSRVYPKLSPEQQVVFEEQERRIRAMVPPPVRPLRDMRMGTNTPVARPPASSASSGAMASSTPPLASTTPRGAVTPPETSINQSAQATDRRDTAGRRERTGLEGNGGAFDQQKEQRRIDKLLARLDSALALTDDQTQQIRAILLEQAGEMRQALTSDMSSDQRHMIRKRIRRQTMFRVIPLLTQEQRQALRDMRRQGRFGPADGFGEEQ